MNTLKQQLPEYANDLKLNISSVIENTEDSSLTTQKIAGVTLACAYATKQVDVIKAANELAQSALDNNAITAAKAAASIMAMNNIYYRAVHLMSDESYITMPAKLRMSVIAKPGIDKIDFELMSLGVSAINGCGKCLDAHAIALEKTGLDKSAIQHTLRIAAVVNGLAQVMEIEQ